MKAAELARCAVMAGLLTAVQFALSFISGIELVTAVFAAYCYVFGAKEGALCGAAFSLIRCLIFGFYPSVILLYLIYYPAFAFVFGHVLRRPAKGVFTPLTFVFSACCIALGAFGLPVSIVYQTRLRVFFFILAFILLSLSVACIIAQKMSKKPAGELFLACSAAALMTVIFTLLDDIMTPLLFGYSKETAAAYFYTSFLAMLPQTACAAISVLALFMPLKSVMERFCHDKK